MIKDSLKNSQTYYGISKRLKEGFEWLKKNDLINMPDGKYCIDGDNLFVNIQTYRTKDSAKFEAHRKYIDIQYMINGEELVGVAEYDLCKKDEPYDTDRDIEFLSFNGKYEKERLKTGYFLVFFPQDAHKPSLNPEVQVCVKKAVVKVLI